MSDVHQTRQITGASDIESSIGTRNGQLVDLDSAVESRRTRRSKRYVEIPRILTGAVRQGGIEIDVVGDIAAGSRDVFAHRSSKSSHLISLRRVQALLERKRLKQCQVVDRAHVVMVELAFLVVIRNARLQDIPLVIDDIAGREVAALLTIANLAELAGGRVAAFAHRVRHAVYQFAIVIDDVEIGVQRRFPVRRVRPFPIARDGLGVTVGAVCRDPIPESIERLVNARRAV